jgi:MlaC protein
MHVKHLHYILSFIICALLLTSCSAKNISQAGSQKLALLNNQTLAPAINRVDKLNAMLVIAMLNDNKAGFSGRYIRLEPYVRESFDFEQSARILLADKWALLDAGKKVALIEKLVKVYTAELSYKFSNYNGSIFSVINGRTTGSGQIELEYALGINRKIYYGLALVDGGWKISNITENGLRYFSIKAVQSSLGVDESYNMLSNEIEEVIVKFANGRPLPVVSEKIESNDIIQKNRDEKLDGAKFDCAQLYKVGSKDYGSCVMKLLD